MYHVGIDPGITGAVSLLGPDVHDVHDMPIKGAKSRSVCPHTLAMLLREFRMACGSAHMHATIEYASPRPGQGLRSTCSTCRGAGIIEGVLAALSVPYSTVTPAKWKAHYNLTRADKDASRGRAMELYPGLADELHLKKHHGRAEAILIAHYAFVHENKH